MLTGANQLLRRCGKYQGCCSWIRIWFISPKRRDTDSTNVWNRLFSPVTRGKKTLWTDNYFSFTRCFTVHNLGPTFQLRLSVSVGLICLEANKPSKGKVDPPEPRFQLLPLPSKFLTVTLKESIVVQPNTAYSPHGRRKKRKWVCTPSLPKRFPAWPCLKITHQGRPVWKRMLSICARKTKMEKNCCANDFI